MDEDRTHIIRALAFTEHGMQTGGRICELLPQTQLTRCPKGGLSSWTTESFETADVIIYIGAVGIAVRAIAPHVVNKLHDPAVLVIDELGRYVIPILSGHVGGANAAASLIAGALGATAVITTATDLNGKFAVDVWAVKNGLTILNKDGIKEVSSRVLKGEPVEVYSQWTIAGKMPEGFELTADPKAARLVIACSNAEIGARSISSVNAAEAATDARTAYAEAGSGAETIYANSDTDGKAPHAEAENRAQMGTALHLAPKCLYVGIGCRRDIPRELIEEAWAQVVGGYGLEPEAVIGVTSIDIKAHEPGLLAFCQAHGWELTTYSGEELNAVPGEFHGSAFVKKTVGVDSVCERSAVLAARAAVSKRTAASGMAAENVKADADAATLPDSNLTIDKADMADSAARLIVPKTAKNGVTIAVALAAPVLSWT